MTAAGRVGVAHSQANAPLSRITLALLEDSGWYMVHNDSSLADNHFTWGFGEGQSFLTQPCNTRSEQYYCQVRPPPPGR
jgi:hypothetical protein